MSFQKVVTPTVLQMEVLCFLPSTCTFKDKGYNIMRGRFEMPSKITGRMTSGPLLGYLVQCMVENRT